MNSMSTIISVFLLFLPYVLLLNKKLSVTTKLIFISLIGLIILAIGFTFYVFTENMDLLAIGYSYNIFVWILTFINIFIIFFLWIRRKIKR